jgi:hypothetical protein
MHLRRWGRILKYSVRQLVLTTMSAIALAQAPSVPSSSPPNPGAPQTPVGTISSGQLESKNSNLPKLTIAPNKVEFSGQILDEASPVRTVILTAGPGNSDLKLSIFGPSGDFAATHDSCQLKPEGSCTISITFTPKQLGLSSSAITVSTADGAIQQTIALTGEGIPCCLPKQNPSWRERAKDAAPVLVIVFVYLIGLVVVRWNLVALPTRALLRAQIAAVKGRIESLYPSGEQLTSGPAQILGLLKSAEDLIGQRGPLATVLDFFLWTRGQELAAWNYVHEAEEQLVHFLPGQSNQKENIRAALEMAEADLRRLGTSVALALADKISQALTASPPLPADRCRPVLEDLLKFLTPQTDTLATEISRAIAPGSGLSLSDFRELANKVVSSLSPADASLATQIQQLLVQPSPSIEQAKPLLQQAAMLLQPEASSLLQKLQQATDPTSALTISDWTTLLTEVQQYLLPQRTKLIDRIKMALSAEPVLPLGRWSALLSEALGLLYDRTDTDFATLISWHNKSIWLIGTGLLLIVSLAAALQHEVLFLVGATGGLLSRLSRSLQRADVPTDYGASWTTLFLSPVVGALAGWSGVLLVVVAVDLNVLGVIFKVDWCNPFCPMALGLAFLLGFSERAFDGILGQLEDKVQAKQSSSTSSQPIGLNIIIPANSGEAKVGQVYDTQLTASGGSSPYKWSLLSGALPSGVTMDSTGHITGTPTTAGPFKATVQVTDATGKATKSQDFPINVAPN